MEKILSRSTAENIIGSMRCAKSFGGTTKTTIGDDDRGNFITVFEAEGRIKVVKVRGYSAEETEIYNTLDEFEVAYMTEEKAYPPLPMGTAMHAVDGVTAVWTSGEMKKYADETCELRLIRLCRTSPLSF